LLPLYHLEVCFQKHVLSTIKEREKQISDSLKNADRIKLELEETEKQQQETFQEASLEAKKTISSAQEQAKALLSRKRKMLVSKLRKSFLKLKLPWSRKGNDVLREAREEIAH
jgi:F0F1-type ATP synthase membrane subunit b/b'